MTPLRPFVVAVYCSVGYGLCSLPLARASTSPAGIVPHPGAVLPGGVELVEADGSVVTSGQLWAEQPTLIAFVYDTCPNQCSILLSSLKAAANALDRPANVLAISIDPHDSPASGAAKLASLQPRPAAKDSAVTWHVLTGTDAAVQALARSAGISYSREANSGQYAHPAVVVSVQPGGRIRRYLYGLAFTARDLRLAVAEAAGAKLGAYPTERLLLLCFHYDEATGHYGPAVMNSLRWLGLAFVALGCLCLCRLARRADRFAQRGASL